MMNEIKDEIGEHIIKFRNDNNYMYYPCLNNIMEIINRENKKIEC